MAARFMSDNKATIPFHCFTHSLKISLQGTGKTLVCSDDAIEIVKEINNHIRFSPKRLHLFSTKLVLEEPSVIKTPMFIIHNGK